MSGLNTDSRTTGDSSAVSPVRIVQKERVNPPAGTGRDEEDSKRPNAFGYTNPHTFCHMAVPVQR